MTAKEININAGGVLLKGDLVIPDQTLGLVVFSHGSGSSRLSRRNKAVAESLNMRGFATLLFDLLTEEEDIEYENRFNIQLLTRRLVDVTQWVRLQPSLASLPVGYFGASTGAASALYAASLLGNEIRAVVSRGGRPDLALEALPNVKSPVLLIVGGLDASVIPLNQQAFQKLTCERELSIVQGATHLFEEPGKLEAVARLAASWYEQYLAGRIASGTR